jgi:DNA-directed RNA polymerase specialized sigma24 family protein
VKLALDAVPSRHAAVLEMMYLEDRPTNEVAAFLGITENACKQLLWRARGSFRMSYRQLGEVA